MQCFHGNNPVFGAQAQLRTQIQGVSQGANGKWLVTFETFRGIPGRETRVSLTSCSPMFESEDEAYAAGARALDCLEQSGMYPNLCEPF